jgi:NADH-quinone oxidoreductase subunit J
MMNVVFYIAAGIATVSTLLVITGRNAVHALLYLVVSFLAISLAFFTLGAPFIAALEVIVYAGAIMVLFVFVIMMLNVGRETMDQERQWTRLQNWIGPGFMSFILLVELVCVLHHGTLGRSGVVVNPKAVSLALMGPYVLAVELASILLLAGLVGAFSLARRGRPLRRRDIPVAFDQETHANATGMSRLQGRKPGS